MSEASVLPIAAQRTLGPHSIYALPEPLTGLAESTQGIGVHSLQDQPASFVQLGVQQVAVLYAHLSAQRSRNHDLGTLAYSDVHSRNLTLMSA